MERRRRNNGLSMTTFRPQRSNPSRYVRRKTDANMLQVYITKCPAKLHSHCHEARKIVCNNFQGAVQAHVTELEFYTPQALPLARARLLRLAQISPLDVWIPARCSGDDHEISSRPSGKISRYKSAPCLGNSQTRRFKRHLFLNRNHDTQTL